jgi:non-specific serine/threonine protein kinase
MNATNLPAPITGFVGRDRESDEVRRLLAGTRLLTLTGAGGVGKTRLALAVAAALVDDLADGVWWADLATLADPSLVPSAVLAALALHEEPAHPPAATLTEYLQARSLLLVLDNCEHLIAACAALVELLLRACPHLRVLATSRQALGMIGETAWTVPPMEVPDARFHVPRAESVATTNGGTVEPGTWSLEREQPDAVRLFVERASSASPRFSMTERNAAAVAEVCGRLDGLPLAIELAAARVKALTVEQIAARLDDCFRLLTTGSRTALPRHQTLRATLDWSHDLLSEREQVLLRRLAVFAGGWTLDAAEQICGNSRRQAAVRAAREPEPLPQPLPDSYLPIEPGEVLDLLTALVEKSLVLAEHEDGTARFRLLETVRQYTGERLDASGEGACARSAHAEYFLTLAETAQSEMQGPERKPALDRLEAEHDNIRAALTWWFDCDVEHALRLAAAVWQFWEARGHIGEGYERLTELLATADVAVPTAGRAEAWRGHAHLASTRGDFETARRSCEESLATSQALGDPRGIAQALLSLGLFASLQGEPAEARMRLEQSLAIMRGLDDRSGIARVLLNYGILLEQLGDYDAARATHEECLAILRALGDRRRIGLSLNNLGEVTAFQGDYATARGLHEEALAINRELGDPGNIAATLAALGRVHVELGDHDAAGRLFGESLAIMQRLGARRVVPRCLEGLAAIAVARRAPVTAARLFGAAEAARQAFGTPVFTAYRPWFDRDVAAARAQLDPEAFAAAWAEGRALPLDSALALALGEAEPTAPPEDGSAGADEFPLSAREREVAVLLTHGLTNRQIADELVVATSTVDRHVVHILRKLDLGNRAQVAAWAVEHRLTGAAP